MCVGLSYNTLQISNNICMFINMRASNLSSQLLFLFSSLPVKNIFFPLYLPAGGQWFLQNSANGCVHCAQKYVQVLGALHLHQRKEGVGLGTGLLLLGMAWKMEELL